MSASLPEPVLAFLRQHGLAAEGEVPRAEALSGGVSSDIWRVDLKGGPVCVKRALPRLRVAQLWEAPVERNAYERRWLETANAIVPGVAPKVLAGDEDAHAGCFAMEYLPRLPVWKAELSAGRADAAFAADVGRKLGAIHNATAHRADLAAAFATDASFYALRLEPYLLATGKAHEDLRGQFEKLVDTTANTRLALVHGDVSPKNVLVGPQGPVFLDAECAWYGDPAFDLAFCLNHLLLKGVWVPARKAAFLACYDALAREYLASVDWEQPAALERRAAALLPGLLLARVDGKSPVEYLTDEADRARVRAFARRFLQSPAATLREVGDAWQES
ncbi:MAG: aminoglycoside phosphotransferase family protein [Burkholderiales bacterium]